MENNTVSNGTFFVDVINKIVYLLIHTSRDDDSKELMQLISINEGYHSGNNVPVEDINNVTENEMNQLKSNCDLAQSSLENSELVIITKEEMKNVSFRLDNNCKLY